jgi:DNA gyrase subunit B
MVFNVTARNISYDAQVKSTVTKIDMTPFTQVVVEQLQFWMNSNEKEVKMIADKALNARKAREAAKKAREAARNKTEKKKKALKFDTKLADCKQHTLDSEIFITEGDSASGNLKLARKNDYQAVLPVRGKILNVRKASLDKIQKNAEIMTMIEAFGLTVDPKTMKLTFDEKDLRYGKIIIMSDADVDGAHIKNLFYTFIWTFCPALIEGGYVYAGVPPLYRVTETKDKYVYLKDDAALEEYRKQHPGKKLTLTRMKGLGEMDAEETKILVDPDKRIINQVTVKDAKAADKLFDDLMGDAVAPRKKYIKEHSAEAMFQI